MHPQSRLQSQQNSGISVTKLFLSCILLLLAQCAAYAQNEFNTPLGLKPGHIAGAYDLNIDSVNLFSGRVSVHIPNEVLAGRGQTSTLYLWKFDTPARWQVYKGQDPWGNPIYSAAGGGSSPWHADGIHTINPVGSGSGYAGQCDTEGWLFAWGKTLTKLFWVEPDGTEHEMRDVLLGGEPKVGAGCNSGWPGHSVNRGRIFVATDGSGATFVADVNIRDGAYMGFEFPYNYDDNFDGWLLLRDGRRIRVSMDNNRGLKDRNGNQFKTPWMGTPTDALNRQLGGGTLTSTQCSALVPGETSCGYNSHKGFGGAERRTHYFIDQNSRVKRIMLPNGRSYVFYYNNYDDVIRIDLPTGGTIEYTFEAGLNGNNGVQWQPWWPPGAYWDSNSNDMHFYRRVTERRVYKEGYVLESRQTFSKPETDHLTTVGYVEKKNYDGSNVLLSTERHYFYGNAEHSFWVLPTDYPSWMDGREYKTETYDAGGNLLKTVLTYWEQRAPVSWWTGSSSDAPSNDVRISQITTLLDNGAQFSNSYGYDSTVPYNSLIDFIERDYNFSILRRTQTTYLKTLNGTDYAGLNVQNASALHIRDLPLQVSTIGWGNVEEARTTYEYDNYTATANHAQLVSRANISGLDPAFTTSYVTRGNATAVTRHLLTNGVVTGSVTSYKQYDVAGNVIKTIDGRGGITTYEYNDRFGGPNGEAQSNSSPSELSSVGQTSYAFPTRVTNPMNMVMYFQFDFHLNQAVDVEDINGIASSAYFAESLDRPTQVITAANNANLKTQTSYSYDDVNRVRTTTKDSTAYLDNLEKSETRFDGMGREVEVRTYESASNYIVTKTNIFGLSTQVSNPYRPWQSETPQWTTTVVDALGRVKTVTTPDNAVVTTTYTGNEATVTDQTGKKRKSISDSLGRVSYVYEDPLGANYTTIYGYNSLGNLVSVAQDYLSQPVRAFVYDSFGRLVSGTNPESGATTFKYDEAGNIVVKTDARGVSTHYSYDALNRPTRRWYNGSNATTATTHNSPALPAGVGTSLESNYFYDQQALPAGAPSFTRGPSNGALVALTHGTGSSDGNYFGKDPVGRDAVKIQRTSGVNYQMSLNYNAVGDVASLVYPSGRSVNYTYDAASRLVSLTGNLGDGTSRTYSTGITYSPFGGISKEQFGTNTPVYQKLHYNIRGQLYDTRASNVDSEWSGELGALVNYFSTQWAHGGSGPDNNGNVLMSQTIINSYYMEDRYAYDALNRLASVSEYQNGSANTGTQTYTYDRWGNRTINPSSWGTGINTKQFTVNPYFNRLGVPGGQPGVMTYDAAGNLTNDTYTGAGNRTYDAENRITSAWGGANQAQLYSYDAKGERIKRIVNNVETWQVYGFTGELLAEYPISGAANRPQQEFGYRNGDLLISAAGRVNVALAANGGVATASTTATGSGFQTSYAINGNNRGPWGNSVEGWNDNTPNAVPDWIQIDFAGSKTINEIDVFGLHDNYTQVNTPTETQTFSLYGLIAFDVQYWNGSSWITVPGGSVTGNNKVWRKFTFANITTTKIRVYINQVPDSWSRVMEIRAYEPSTTGEKIEWMIVDHLDTPRMIVDQTGLYANIRRHDYLPYGEDLSAGVGGRTTGLGYVADGTRQKFTGYEFDGETGLNYAEARYQSSVQGRFTSTDPVSGTITDPQSWNMYSYVGNNPINRTDPTGMSYFMGSGANDPWIRENAYRVDGFDMSPPGTASNLTDESMLSYAPNWFLMNEGMPASSTSNSNSDSQEASRFPGPPYNDHPYIEIIFWKGTTNGGRDPGSAFGHVSYVIDGRAYSWEKYTNPQTGKEEWRTARPASIYSDDRRKLSSGIGYILNFGSPVKNRQFQAALLGAYRDTGGYHLTKNNCAHAFQRAINKMKLPGVPQNTAIRPSQHEKFLKTHLWQYVVGGAHYKKSK